MGLRIERYMRLKDDSIVSSIIGMLRMVCLEEKFNHALRGLAIRTRSPPRWEEETCLLDVTKALERILDVLGRHGESQVPKEQTTCG